MEDNLVFEREELRREFQTILNSLDAGPAMDARSTALIIAVMYTVRDFASGVARNLGKAHGIDFNDDVST